MQFRIALSLGLPCLFLLLGIAACQENEPAPYPETNPDSKVYSQYGTPFTNIPEAADIVMYEVNLRAFSAKGDLQGVIDRLDHIQDLGVNVIWLMPIHPIGQIKSVNSPYSVKNYKAIGAEYGDLDDLRQLTDEAHLRGMAVIMDWVANHTAWDNAWMDSTNWYTQDMNGNIIHPPGTNWQDVADLNYGNENMRAAMIDAMKYWLYEANVDGFRCDYADGVPFDFWQTAWRAIDSIPNREFVLFAEGTRSDHFDAGFDLNFGWPFYGAIKDVFNGQPVSRIFSTHNNQYNNTPTGKHWLRFTTNHDESAWDATPIQIFNGKDGALAASVATIFTGGVPLIYGSQEVGTANNIPFFSNSQIAWNDNPDMRQAYEEILQFYRDSEVARIGQNTVFPHNDVACFTKSFQNEEVLIIINLRNSNINFPVPSALVTSVWNNVLSGSQMTLSGLLNLAPYQFYILKS